MFRVVLLAGLLAYGAWWFFVGGRQMTEDMVNAHYEAEMQAAFRFDSETLCDEMAGDYRATGINFSAAGTQRFALDKAAACQQMDRAFRGFKRLAALSGGMFELSFDQRVVEVRLSDDRRTATVESISQVSMGGQTVSRTHALETLVRRNGVIRHVAAESKNWLYADGH